MANLVRQDVFFENTAGMADYFFSKIFSALSMMSGDSLKMSLRV